MYEKANMKGTNFLNLNRKLTKDIVQYITEGKSMRQKFVVGCQAVMDGCMEEVIAWGYDPEQDAGTTVRISKYWDSRYNRYCLQGLWSYGFPSRWDTPVDAYIAFKRDIIEYYADIDIQYYFMEENTNENIG